MLLLNFNIYFIYIFSTKYFGEILNQPKLSVWGQIETGLKQNSQLIDHTHYTLVMPISCLQE